MTGRWLGGEWSALVIISTMALVLILILILIGICLISCHAPYYLGQLVVRHAIGCRWRGYILRWIVPGPFHRHRLPLAGLCFRSLPGLFRLAAVVGLDGPFVFEIPLIIVRIIVSLTGIIIVDVVVINAIVIIVVVDLFLLQLVVDHTGQLLQALVEQHFFEFFFTWTKNIRKTSTNPGDNALCVYIYIYI